MSRKGYLWMAVTADEYEHPIAIADSSTELAEMLGINPSTIRTNLQRGKNGAVSGRRILKVRKDDETY